MTPAKIEVGKTYANKSEPRTLGDFVRSAETPTASEVMAWAAANPAIVADLMRRHAAGDAAAKKLGEMLEGGAQ